MRFEFNPKFSIPTGINPRMAWIYCVDQGRHLPTAAHAAMASRYTPCVDAFRIPFEIFDSHRDQSTHGVDLLCRPRSTPTNRRACAAMASRATPCVDAFRTQSEIFDSHRDQSTHGVDLLCRSRSTPTNSRACRDGK
ncbi:hypothetical protein C1930_14440 [Stenotrophomonas sp. SAU14A_NAIMI4_8]|nr:hypothetical protein C1930_14440 [Stenotrophomonas sp. SAU14A_NAIMI4_8]